MILKIGSHGPEVLRLQQMLQRLGGDLQADGYFGRMTDRVLREVKRRIGFFPPDGTVGQRAMAALETADDDPASDTIAMQGSRAQHIDLFLEHEDVGACAVIESDVHLARAWATQFPRIFDLPGSPATMNTSPQGLRFIEKEEELAGVTNHIHFPGGSSGVTLGPGYDMRHKDAAEIVRDLTRIGVPRDAAMRVSQASQLTNENAASFCRQNKYAVDLSSFQQAALLATTVGRYEELVKDRMTVPLYAHEFDALVSFAYNSGGALDHVTHALNMGRVQEAMGTVSQIVNSGGSRMEGLVRRRRGEIALYLYGKYHD